jgi:hypothetical protein
MDPQTDPTPDPIPSGGDPPPPTPVDDDADPDSLAVEVERPGGKVSMVPLPALKQARERLKTRSDEAKAARDEAAALRQQLEAAAPIMQLVNANPAILQQVQEGKVPTRTEPSEDDKDAAEAAQLLGLYTPQGVPDVVAGRKMLELQDRRTQRQVRPMQQQTAQQAANANYQRALAARDPQGRLMARPETIRETFSMVPPELAADPKVAEILLMTARGKDAEYLASLPVAPAGGPIFSEATSNRPADTGLTAQEQRASRSMNVSEKDWQRVTNRKGGLWAPFESE